MTNLNGRKLSSFQKRMLAWYARHKRAMPWRGTRDAYRVWVSEIMLQQTRVAAVLPYYRRFVKRFPTVRTLARARNEDVLKMWAGLGYYSRARNLHAAAREIVAQHGGKFPREHEAALALPGVGRYTAAAVLSIAYGERLAVLDGNVARVLARLGGMRGDLRAKGRWKKLEARAQEVMANKQEEMRKRGSEERKGKAGVARSELRAAKRRSRAALHTAAGEWNQAMMELGATVCTPRGPRCGECPVARWCKAKKLGIAEQIPLARKKRATERMEIAAAVMVDGSGRTLLVKPEKAETNGLFSGMWQFPVIELRNNGNILEPQMNADKRGWGKKRGKDLTQRTQRGAEGTEQNQEGSFPSLRMTGEAVELEAVKHCVTYREITLRPFLMRVRELPAGEGARVVELKRLCDSSHAGAVPQRYIPPISSATKKIAERARKALSADFAERI